MAFTEARGSSGVALERNEMTASDRSLTELMRQLSDDSLHLVKAEAQLYRAETEVKLRRMQREVTVLGAGALVGFLGAQALVAALVFLLALAMDLWVAALIVGLVLVSGGIAAVIAGKKQLEQEQLAPEQTTRSVRQDLRTIQEALR